MFKILENTFRKGIATTGYPATGADLPQQSRGLPEFDWANVRDADALAAACPSGAIAVNDESGSRRMQVDYGKCIFCGECATVDGAVRVTNKFELAATNRGDLVVPSRTGVQACHSANVGPGVANSATVEKFRNHLHRLLGRSLAIREVDAGSCNACELEINALNNPVYDAERFGIHFVASPRHADMLLVTGPVTRNMELALRKTYDATPDPKLVVAAGACAISGGMFGENYATRGSVDRIIPVDVYVPGCPPRPEALLFGIMLAVGRARRH